MKRLLLLGTLTFFMTSLTYAQVRTVQGQVISKTDKSPLIGVTVFVNGTSNGTTTDFDGHYSINLNAGEDTLTFSYIGFTSQVMPVGLLSTINVELAENEELLTEVVVVGYGTQRKSDLTGSVSSVRGADLTKIPSMSPEQALQGKVAGVQVNSASGAPGSVPVVRIRGVGTLNNSAPIYVVDGVILDDISFLSASDIESMEILKDASATAIYGSRGANGVVIVSTKNSGAGGSGRAQPAIVDVTTELSFQHLQKKIDLLTGKQFATVANQINPGTFLRPDTVKNTDWQDQIFKKLAPIYSVHASISGATEKNRYYFGLGYYSQDGLIAKSDYQRVSLKLNNTYSVTRNISIGINYTVSPDKKTNEPGVVGMAYRAWPTSVPYKPDGSYAEVLGAGNPLAAIEYNNSDTKRVRGVGNMFAEVKFLKHFTARSSFGQDYSHVTDRVFVPVFFVSAGQSNSLSDLTVTNTNFMTWLWENTLTYNVDLNKHHFDVLAGYTSQKYKTEKLEGKTQDLIGSDPALWYIQAGNPEYTTVTNTGEITTLVSTLGRFNYQYDSRYLFTASFRRDGSSKFGANNRYGNFPSFAAGWNIHNEEFFGQNRTVNKLKLRGSWGRIGNEKITWSRQYSLVNNGQNAVFDETLVQGATYGVSGNQDLRWEETTQVDVGLEVGLLKDKIQIELDYYHKVTDGILVDLLTPGHLGNGPYAAVTYNAAKVLNEGFELSLTYNGRAGNVDYRLSGNGSTIHNEVLSLGENRGTDAFIASGSLGNGQLVSRTVVGRPVGAFFGYETNGVIQNEAELSSSPVLAGEHVGDLKFVDQNGDGIIDSRDRVYLGSYIPKVVYGFSAQFTYRKWDAGLDFSGQWGNKIYNGKMAVRPDVYNFESRVREGWNGEGSSNTEPRPTFGGANYEASDYFIENGSYFRLRTVTIGYTMKGSQEAKVKYNTIRICLRATNLFTLSKYTGYTPEIASTDAVSSGIDLGTYPVTAIYSFGINLTF